MTGRGQLDCSSLLRCHHYLASDGDQLYGDQLDGDQLDGDQLDGNQLDGDQLDGDQLDGDRFKGTRKKTQNDYAGLILVPDCRE